MAEVLFYHLTQRTVDGTLPSILARALDRGWRAAVRCADPAMAAHLDDLLWTFDPDSFLPHGRDGEGAADHPVLITPGPLANDPDVLVLLGAEATDEEMARLARTCLIFGTAEVEEARHQWRRTVAAGLPATYWAEDGGRWREKAKSTP